MGGAVVICNGVLDNGQTQSRAADGAGVALIHPVEPLKDPALLCRRDADAGSPVSTVTLPPGTLYFTAFSQRLYTVSASSRRTPVMGAVVPTAVSVTFLPAASSVRERTVSSARS